MTPVSKEHELKLFLSKRIFAKCVDLLLFFILAAFLPYPLGSLLGIAYCLLADALPIKGWEGQSVGKKITGLRAVAVHSKAAITWKESIQRNSPVGFVAFFSLIPFLGWILLLLVGIPLVSMEIYLMFTVGQGRRLGDSMADTEVVSIHGQGNSH